MASSSLKVAVAGGTGKVGITLAQRLIAKGHHILIGSSDPASEKAVAAVAAVAGAAKLGGSVVAKLNPDAAAEASVILLTFPSATSAKACAEFVALLGDTTAKVIIDTMNPIGKSFQLELEGIDSLGEEFARLMPKAHVFKAFNSIGVEHMGDPTHEGKPFDMLFAGDADAATQAVAHQIIADVGFNPVYVGPIRASRNLESICELWIHMSYKYGTGKGGKFGFGINWK